MSAPLDVVIYHNPDCGTSRNTLALIRNAGIEPHVVEYLKTPPARALLASLIERMGVTVRSVLREKGTPYAELGLGDPSLDDQVLLDAMMEHPILINRPIVVSPRGVRLCRPRKPCSIWCRHRSSAPSPRRTASAWWTKRGTPSRRTDTPIAPPRSVEASRRGRARFDPGCDGITVARSAATDAPRPHHHGCPCFRS